MTRRYRRAGGLRCWAMAAGLCLVTCQDARPQNAPMHWVGTWAAAPVQVDNSQGPIGTVDSTLREMIHTSMAGKTVRIVISNEMGTTALNIGGASIALRAAGVGPAAGLTAGPAAGPAGAPVAGSTTITFGGRTSVQVPVGAKVFSDAVAFDLPAGADVSISLFVPKQLIPKLTTHTFANQPNFLAPGDQRRAATLTEAVESDSWVFLSAVEVQASAQAGAVVTLGDRITDGAFSTRGANRRGPDDLARRLQGNPKTAQLSVLNEGIGGNRILHSERGATAVGSAMERFDRDVLSQAGVRYLILLEGINDIGVGTGPDSPHDTVTAEELSYALAQLVERAHTHGIKVYLGTIMPDKGLGFYYTEAGEAERQAVNRWIRANKVSDGVIDFDKALRDPGDPQRLLPAFDIDHIHPNDAGHQAMADAIDLSLFTR